MRELPEAFCWTKYGAEAGEGASSILRRKELERLATGGIFLWGIGNAIGPSLEQLLGQACEPKVVFTPMLSRPAAKDAAPSRVHVWQRGEGLDGAPFELPKHTKVTSRDTGSNRPHYALVCQRTEPITQHDAPASFAASSVANLRSGSPVGASQVTAVVRRAGNDLQRSGSHYTVAFVADLVFPYLVRLTEPAVV